MLLFVYPFAYTYTYKIVFVCMLCMYILQTCVTLCFCCLIYSPIHFNCGLCVLIHLLIVFICVFVDTCVCFVCIIYAYVYSYVVYCGLWLIYFVYMSMTVSGSEAQVIGTKETLSSRGLSCT